MLRVLQIVRTVFVFSAVTVLSVCTQPLASTVQQQEVREEEETIVDVTIDVDSPSDLESYFDEELSSSLDDDITVEADVSGADAYSWRVNGENPEDNGLAHMQVAGETDEALLIERDADGFTDKYPRGSLIGVALHVAVDGTIYSASHDFIVK